ncbi:hypothetical protein GQX74_015165 [Glossina fuscipes]|nr:hypothetical protein GQX74_015165 [Glossina fuscipes]
MKWNEDTMQLLIERIQSRTLKKFQISSSSSSSSSWSSSLGLPSTLIIVACKYGLLSNASMLAFQCN